MVACKLRKSKGIVSLFLGILLVGSILLQLKTVDVSCYTTTEKYFKKHSYRFFYPYYFTISFLNETIYANDTQVPDPRNSFHNTIVWGKWLLENDENSTATIIFRPFHDNVSIAPGESIRDTWLETGDYDMSMFSLRLDDETGNISGTFTWWVGPSYFLSIYFIGFYSLNTVIMIITIIIKKIIDKKGSSST